MKKLLIVLFAVLFLIGCEYFAEYECTVYYLVSGETQSATITYLDENETIQTVVKGVGDWEYEFQTDSPRVNHFVNALVHDGKTVEVYVEKSSRDWFVSCDDECGINTVCDATVIIEL